MTDALNTKKNMILDTARALGIQKWTPAEIDQLRRKLIADHGEAGKTGNDYIAEVLKTMGWKVQLTEREEAEERFEEEFEDILHFKTLADAEVSITHLDELMRRFRAHGSRRAGSRSRAAREAARGDDLAQSQSGSPKARGEKRNRGVVSYLAGNAGCILRLA